jgi:ankyrin repeat protein
MEDKGRKDTNDIILKYLKYFASQGADVNVKDPIGYTPLYAAVGLGSLEVTKFLVLKGADVQAKSANGETPLHMAMNELAMCVGAVESFTSKAPKESSRDVSPSPSGRDARKSPSGREFTSLQQAQTAMKEQVEIVKFLVAEGADIHAKDNEGNTTLYDAFGSGNLDVVKFLVSKGVDVNAKDEYGGTPLHIAVAVDNLEVVKFLISKGANVNAKTNDGTTPLHMADRDSEVAKFLVSKGTVPAPATPVFTYVKILANAIEVYTLDMRQPPSNEQGLQTLDRTKHCSGVIFRNLLSFFRPFDVSFSRRSSCREPIHWIYENEF